MQLTQMKCEACEGGTPPLNAEDLKPYFDELKGEWELVEGKKIRRVFGFKDFKEAMEWVNKVAGLAEEQGHHPDITINWNKVTIELSTHAIGGLSKNDFILASKIELI